MNPIHTGRGDDGTTSLGDGERVPKTDPRVEAFGALDEACSAVGVARSFADDEMIRDVLRFVQQRLMNCASRLAVPAGGHTDPTVDALDEDVAFIERSIDFLEECTGPLDHFILPGGCTLAAQLHSARTVIRRAERRVVALGPAADRDQAAARLLNRCSDLLFAMARYANQQVSRTDVAWDRAAAAPDLSAYHSD